VLNNCFIATRFNPGAIQEPARAARFTRLQVGRPDAHPWRADGAPSALGSIRYLKLSTGTTGRRTSPVKERTREQDGSTTVDEGLDLVEQAYPGRPIPAKVKFLLAEIVDSMEH
jgi:hypothetical protein